MLINSLSIAMSVDLNDLSPCDISGSRDRDRFSPQVASPR